MTTKSSTTIRRPPPSSATNGRRSTRDLNLAQVAIRPAARNGKRHLRENLELAEELAEQIVIREGEVTVRITRMRALLKRFVAKAMEGDPKMARLLVDLSEKQPATEDADAVADDDEAFINQLVAEKVVLWSRGMSYLVAAVLLSNFELFVRVAFRHLHDGRKLGNEPYIQYLVSARHARRRAGRPNGAKSPSPPPKNIAPCGVSPGLVTSA